MTELQGKALEFIARHIADNGWAPSRKEIADELGISLTWAQQTVKALADQGAIDVKWGAGRAIKVLP